MNAMQAISTSSNEIDICAQKRMTEKLSSRTTWRRLFSTFSFGRRHQQRHSKPSASDAVNEFYIARAAEKRLRKFKRGHGFSRPFAA